MPRERVEVCREISAADQIEHHVHARAVGPALHRLHKFRGRIAHRDSVIEPNGRTRSSLSGVREVP